MVITKAKYWTKPVQGENVEHVQIGYTDDESEILLHESGPNSVGTQEFYDAFANLPLYVCKICGLDESLKTGIFCRDVSITPNEDKDGNDTTVYKLMCTLKAGHANAVLVVSIQHKFIPEGFAAAIERLVDVSKKYVEGERNQVDAFEQGKADAEKTAENNPDLFDSDDKETDPEAQEE